MSVKAERFTGDHPVTGEPVVSYSVPDGCVMLMVSRETVEAHAEWRECAAVRIRLDESGEVAELEVTDDLDWLTSGEAGA